MSPDTSLTSSLPPTTEHGGEPRRVDVTLACTVWGYKAIDKLDHAFQAGSFDNNSHLSIKGVAVFSLSTTSKGGGSKPGQASSRHHSPVLEMAYLASLLVCPADQVEAETPLYPNTLSWRFNLCQVGWGHLSSTSDPDQQALQLEGFTLSLPHPWPAATTAEEGATTQTTTLLPRLKALASCYRF
jgi:hypothetical protein